MRTVEGGHQTGATSRHPTALYCDLAGRRHQPSARRAAPSAPPRRLSRPRSPRWRSSERSIATLLTHSPFTIVQIEPRASPSAATNGGERGEAGPVGTFGCRLDSDRRAARREPARPNRAPQRTPSARGGIASSAAACGASRPSAVATRSHTRAARNLDTPSVSNAQSARQGRSRDDRNRRPHAIGVSLRMFRIACVHVCVRLRGPAVASSGGAGRARGTPSYLVGFARC